jgi:hypothetical protein
VDVMSNLGGRERDYRLWCGRHWDTSFAEHLTRLPLRGMLGSANTRCWVCGGTTQPCVGVPPAAATQLQLSLSQSLQRCARAGLLHAAYLSHTLTALAGTALKR